VTPPALGTTTTLSITNIPAGSLFGATVLGWSHYDPGLELAGIGMAGCRQYASVNVVAPFAPSGSSAKPAAAGPVEGRERAAAWAPVSRGPLSSPPATRGCGPSGNGSWVARGRSAARAGVEGCAPLTRLRDIVAGSPLQSPR
jgi:hypothetical protein